MKINQWLTILAFSFPMLMIGNKVKNSKVMGMDLTAFKKEITRRRHHWSIRPPDDPLPETLVETLRSNQCRILSWNFCGS